MNTLFLNIENDSQKSAIEEVVKKFSIESSVVDREEFEDYVLGNMIKSSDKTDLADKDLFLRELKGEV